MERNRGNSICLDFLVRQRRWRDEHGGDGAKDVRGLRGGDDKAEETGGGEAAEVDGERVAARRAVRRRRQVKQQAVQRLCNRQWGLVRDTPQPTTSACTIQRRILCIYTNAVQYKFKCVE